MARRCNHCTVWVHVSGGAVVRGCPHCWTQFSRHDEDAAIAELQCSRSREAHDLVCKIPVRWQAFSSEPTRVAAPASRVDSSVRAARLRALGRR